MDVARAADPERAEAARARLKAHAAGTADGTFEVSAPAPKAAAARMPEHYVQFEAMVLQSFLQTMLPEENAFYGEGLSGDMWRGLLAQELGEAVARRGGIGIAERVLGDYTLEDGRKVPVSGVSSRPQVAEAASQSALANGLVQEIERQMARRLSADATALPAKDGRQ